MELAVDVPIIILLFAVFGDTHSLLASEKVKISFKKIFGDLIAFYRLLYNLFGLLSLYLIYEFSPKPHIIIYDLPNPYDLIILIPQFVSLAGVLWVFRYICFKEFLGLDQIKRFFEKRYTTELDEEFTLRIEGPSSTSTSGTLSNVPRSYSGKRLLNGAYWFGVTRATTTQAVACWGKEGTDTVSLCAHSHYGDTGNTANYSYDDAGDP